jgi:hypothetical protein
VYDSGAPKPATAGAPTGCPHSAQNFAVGETWVPQLEQVRMSAPPHSSQNFALGEFSCWHREHVISGPPIEMARGPGQGSRTGLNLSRDSARMPEARGREVGKG